MMKQFEVLDITDRQGFYLIKLTEGDFSGIIYSFGKVYFTEEGDHARLHFDYDIENKDEFPNIDVPKFEQVIGDILMDLISEGVAKNELVYKGGVDEDRTEDSNKSDS